MAPDRIYDAALSLAPDTIIASGRTPDGGARTRPLCPHPQVATYDGSGSPDEAGNFTCAVPGAAAAP